MADEASVDEYGKPVRATYKKVIEPRPHEEDLTRVRTGPEPGDYEYVDPITLFQLERLVPALKDVKTKGERYQAGRGFPKYCREIAERALPFWPPAGYAVRLGAHLSDYDNDAARAIGGAGAVLEPQVAGPAEQLPPLPADAYPADAVALEGVPVLGDPDVPEGWDPEVEHSGAVPAYQ